MIEERRHPALSHLPDVCGVISPDEREVCIKPRDHEDEHGWATLYTQTIIEPLKLTGPSPLTTIRREQEERYRDMVAQDVAQMYAGPTPLLDAFSRSLPRRPPPSRYTRLRWRLRAAQRRVQDAWRVLWHGLPEHDD